MCGKDFLKKMSLKDFLPGPGMCCFAFVYLFSCAFAYLSLQRFLQRDRCLVLAVHYFPPFLQAGSLGGKNAFSPMPSGLSCFVGRDRID